MTDETKPKEGRDQYDSPHLKRAYDLHSELTDRLNAELRKKDDTSTSGAVLLSLLMTLISVIDSLPKPHPGLLEIIRETAAIMLTESKRSLEAKDRGETITTADQYPSSKVSVH